MILPTNENSEIYVLKIVSIPWGLEPSSFAVTQWNEIFLHDDAKIVSYMAGKFKSRSSAALQPGQHQ